MNKLVLTTEMIVSLLHWDFIYFSSEERLQFFKKDTHMHDRPTNSFARTNHLKLYAVRTSAQRELI